MDGVAGIAAVYPAVTQRLEESFLSRVLRYLDHAAADLAQRVRIGAGAAGQVSLLGPVAGPFVERRLVDAGVEVALPVNGELSTVARHTVERLG